MSKNIFLLLINIYFQCKEYCAKEKDMRAK